MGYRQYFERVKKEKLEEVRNLNLEELLKYAKENGVEVDEEESWIYFLDLLKSLDGVEVFGFGKYYENASEICNLGTPMFRNEDVQTRYEDYFPYVVNKEAVACAIEWQRQKILTHFKTLLLDDEQYRKKERFDKRTKLERLEEEIRDKVSEWECDWIKPYNLDNEKNHCIVNSWLYEYTIFDLVRIYRDTDWDNETLIFYGY